MNTEKPSNEEQSKPSLLGNVSESLLIERDKLVVQLNELQRLNKIHEDEFQKGYLAGFKDGANAIINKVASNDR